MNEDFQRWLGTGVGVTRRLARVSKHGQALLYLPTSRALALSALDLYPAQRRTARIARTMLKAVCGIGLARTLPSTSLCFPNNGPTATFLRGIVGEAQAPPKMAILAGNPHAEGRRYILLLYNQSNQPTAVVKLGLNKRAAELIDQEAAVLEAIGDRIHIAPKVIALHEVGATRAIAFEYIHGHTPKHATAEELARVLTPWIDSHRELQVEAVPIWQRLVHTCGANPLFGEIRGRLQSGSFHPVMFHGDFAPWNVRVQSDGSWRVLDWERGELAGIPCWDWYHYRLQVGLLVDRLDPQTHLRSIHQLWADPTFCRYTRTAKVHRIVQELLLAYLLYNMHVIGPKESLPAKQALLETLTARWKSG